MNDMNQFFNSVRTMCILFTALVVCACAIPQTASRQSPQVVTAIADSDAMDYWWYCRFKLKWSQDTAPDMSVDLVLAHVVVAPVLENYRNRLKFWRFHRRAVADAAGHQFSFIFYSNAATANEILQELEKSAVLQDLIATGIVTSFTHDDTSNPQKPDIAATSDPAWSATMQENWPAYIMGVSETWLGMIDSYTTNPENPTDTASLLDQYRETSRAVTESWRREGQHAFLHHLNAVFGYEPMIIQNEIRF